MFDPDDDILDDPRPDGPGPRPAPVPARLSLPDLDELRAEGLPVDEKRYLNFRLVPKKKGGGFTKEPFVVDDDGTPRHRASTKNPASWFTAAAVIARAREGQRQGHNIGVGLALPGRELERALGLTPIRVLDADAALEPDGTPKPWAAEAYRRLPLIRLSPSGKGFHGFVLGTTAHTKNSKRDMGEPDEPGGKAPGFQLLGASSIYVTLPRSVALRHGRSNALPDEEWECARSREFLETTVPVEKAIERPRIDVEPSADVAAVLGRLPPRLRELVDQEAGDDGDRSKHGWITTKALVRERVPPADILALVADRQPFAEKAWANRGDEKGALDWFKKYTLETALADEERMWAELPPPGGISEADLAADFGIPILRAPTPTEPAALLDLDRERQPFATTYATDFEPKDWAIRRLVACGAVTGLVGVPGAGKSFLAKRMALCVAAGLPFEGLETVQGPVVMLCGEEDALDLRNRMRAVGRSLGIVDQDMIARLDRDLYLIPRAGRDNTLVESTANEPLRITALYPLLLQEIGRVGPRLVILDTSAQMIHMPEGDRAGWTRALAMLAALAAASPVPCAVVLVAHPAKADSEGYSGTTGIEGAWRARIQVTVEKDGSAKLRLAKSNNTARDIEIHYRRRGDGALEPVASTLDDDKQRQERDARARKFIRTKLAELRGRRIAASASAQAATYFPRLVAKDIAAEAGLTGSVVAATVKAMIDDGELVPAANVAKRADRKWKKGLALPEWVEAAKKTEKAEIAGKADIAGRGGVDEEAGKAEKAEIAGGAGSDDEADTAVVLE